MLERMSQETTCTKESLSSGVSGRYLLTSAGLVLAQPAQFLCERRAPNGGHRGVRFPLDND